MLVLGINVTVFTFISSLLIYLAATLVGFRLFLPFLMDGKKAEKIIQTLGENLVLQVEDETVST